MIKIYQRIDPGSRTASRGSAWIATTIIAGVVHEARSRSGAPFELARQLVAAGVADQPAQVHTDGIKGFITYKSLAKMAELTIAESATVPVSARKWSEFRSIGGKTGVEWGEGDAQYPDIKKTPDATPLAAIAAE